MSTKTYTLPTPKLGQVSISGTTYSFTAFYYPGYNDSCDNFYHTPYFGNFYPCNFDVTIDGITGSFENAESAYQATKWWNDPAILNEFEKASSGDDAFHLKRKLEKEGTPENRCSLDRRNAMLAVCKAKFSIPEFNKELLATHDAYLLEHNNKVDRDKNWSDNHDGTGHNWLGLTLMDVRKHYGGNGAPAGSYQVIDFTNQVKKDIGS